ncbi:MAG: ribosome biogenesis GTP-binding protein YihA/YsxC [Fluviicoccus sp.]|uniref:ribosome biogenesis GTP-binding protein YihA/YsxC n=1 Tax=Fluviicoccus sp. TaxID=2003552 RepID=UPI0027213546|nr:ribosome biogenesis GTP-binding protein YihA/YsxC [Fluviicoccus sp.]MDO8331045.1 ribosome biogenesis GTP-binding protein YihA/YsxC [Fluviicoccus sp.]
MAEQHPVLGLLQKAQFMTSAPRLSACPPGIGHEVAFVGRSNAGKSSAINALTRQRQLARASKTPGRTQLLNFFGLDEERRLVDLPGYGYAAVPEAMKIAWQKELQNYLLKRDSLRGLMLLMDIRHPLLNYDVEMLKWAQAGNLPVHILLTKCDKLNRGPAMITVQNVAKQLKEKGLHATISLFSALRGIGMEDAADKLGEWLHYPPTEADAIPEATPVAEDSAPSA